MAKFDRKGPFKGSFAWNRASRKRSDGPKEEDWAWHDKD